MIEQVMLNHWSTIFIAIHLSSYDGAAFEVRVLTNQMVAVHGSPAVLGCAFSPPPSLQDVVITWQRTEDKRVVHSYYYGTDQLERQSPAYKGRTALYHGELERGNASLRLARPGRGDTGGYLCSVSTSQGTDKAEMRLGYAAVFSEPRLSILAHDSSFTIRYESQGYPEPEVQWKGCSEQNLTHSSEVLEAKEDPDLLTLKTQVEVENVCNLSWTLVVVNRPLGQVMERTASFIYDDQRTQVDCRGPFALSAMCVAGTLALCTCGLIVLWRRRTKMSSVPQ
ncbi:V-set domain-containing T-cell activation inhibitor 1-like [Engraulis encrasicolus]|uniref:V-set domain-containing T-cell activation inhibitor 1-like n=1 Tax=Engraulis encrasicolus TaxID=184585 RepID=UPI002FCFB311